MLNWLSNRHGDAYLYEVNREAFAEASADDVIPRRIGSTLLEDDWLYVVVGSDSGLLPRYVATHLPRDSKARYLFVEDDDVLATLNERGMKLPENVQVCSLSELDDCRNRAGFAQFCFRDRVRVLRSIAAEDDFAKLYARLFEAVSISQVKAVQSVKISAGSKVFLEKQILNAPDYLLSVTAMTSRLAGKDVLILAGGPSLDDHLDWVKLHRDSFVIIAVARIGGVLAAHGIRPDFFAVVDPHPVMLTVARDALLQFPDVPLLANFHSNPTVISNWRADVYVAGRRLPWESSLNIPSLATPGPTVTHFALFIAVQALPRTIYLVGMDLCFGGNGLKSHSALSTESTVGPALGQQTGVQQVRTYAGDIADSDVHLLISVDSAAVIARSAAKMGVPIFNLSRSAAEVPGIAYRDPLSLDLDRSMGSPIAPDTGSSVSSLESVGEYLGKLLVEFESLTSELLELRRKLEVNEKKIIDLFDSRGVIRSEISRQVGSVDTAVGELDRSLGFFLQKWGAGYFLASLSSKGEEEISPEDLKRYYAEYYSAFLRSISEVIDVIQIAARKCERRLRELDGADLAALCEAWIAEAECLRIEKRMLQAVLQVSAGYPEARERLYRRFKDLYDGLAQADEARCRKAINQRSVLTKAYYLYERKRVEALGELVAFVGSGKSENLSPGLPALVRGLIYELDGGLDDALREYESVLDENDSGLFELALAQILVIARARDDLGLSIQALDCLESLSKRYLKYHAEVLLQVGDVRGALDKLADYHEVFPDDMDNLVRIVEIYQSSGNTSEAKNLLDELVKVHPDHVGVKRMVRTLAAAEGSPGIAP